MKKRYTVAVDFDGVLHSYTTPWKNAWTIPDPPVEGAMVWLDSISHEFDVVIFTTRGRTWRGRRAVRRWLYRHGGYFDADRFRVTATKPAALIYLDDRAVRFEGPGSYPNPDVIHRARPWNKRRPSHG